MTSRPSKLMILIYVLALIHMGFVQLNEELLVALCFILFCWFLTRPGILSVLLSILLDRLTYVGKVLGKDSVAAKRRHIHDVREVVLSMDTLASDVRNTVEYGLDTITAWCKILNQRLGSIVDSVIEDKLNTAKLRHMSKATNSYELIRMSLRNAISKRAMSSINTGRDISKAIGVMRRDK